MARRTQRESIDMMRSAVRDGFQQMRESLGKQTDPKVALYEQMKPEDIADIAAEVGLEPTIDWIKQMEAKRVGVIK